jgi:hypothetical protein
MNISRALLALGAVACFPLAAAAAPAPVPGPASLGPITDALRLHGMLAKTVPPHAVPAVMVEEGVIGLEYRTMVPVTTKRVVTQTVAETRAEKQKVRGPGGKVEEVTRYVTVMVPVSREVAVTEMRPGGKPQIRKVTAKACKFFEVSKEGKLKALDAAKATALLKKKTAILTGNSAEVDPRHLTLVKPGTLYLVLPPPEPLPSPLKPPPDEKPRT